MMRCQICSRHSVLPALNIGQHPVASKFLESPNADETAYEMTLGVCEHCGTTQLLDSFLHDMLIPSYSWFVPREPEAHLDELVDFTIEACRIKKDAVICGLSIKDSSTIDRFRRKGFSNSFTLSPTDFDISNPCAGVETLQGHVNPWSIKKITDKRGGKVDLLIARHILEHAENVQMFARSLTGLITSNGHLLFEVPDNRRNLERRDYTLIWEEHSVYFVPETLELAMSANELVPVQRWSFPFPYENSLVQIAKKNEPTLARQVSEFDPANLVQLTLDFGADFLSVSDTLRNYLTSLHSQGRRFALYGAGHLTCAFVNYHRIGHLFEMVVDDTPQKQGLFMPGSRLPIVPSAQLVARKITDCLLGLAPENESKVIQRNQAWEAAGNRFHSVLAASDRFILNRIGQPAKV